MDAQNLTHEAKLVDTLLAYALIGDRNTFVERVLRRRFPSFCATPPDGPANQPPPTLAVAA